MGTFTMRHEFECGVERFWELFFDTELQKRTFAELGFPKWELIEQKDTGSEIIRIVKAVPKLDAPATVTKVLGPGFGYTEDGRWDKATKVYRFVVKPSALADKLKNEGKVTCEPRGEGKCTRVVEIVAEAKIFGIGGMLEKVTEKSTRDGWERGAQILAAHIKANPQKSGV